jgi:DNA invertase Pin-like site-specific DNA recombinase
MAKRKNDITTATRAVIYLRVSTDEQAGSGLGLDAQESTARVLCAARGWEVTCVSVDAGVSGSVAPVGRPGMSAALAVLCAGDADVLVAAKLDRLSRSTRHMLGLVDESARCGFSIVTADGAVDSSTPMGRFITTAMSGVAELEREMISQRTTDALAQLKARGARLGGPVTTPQVIRERVAELRAAGLSLAKVTAALNVEGHRTSVGTPWTRAGVQRLADGLKLDAQADSIRTMATT